MRSIVQTIRLLLARVLSTKSTIWASADCLLSCVTSTSKLPLILSVPANTSSPTRLLIGNDSPLSNDSSTSPAPRRTTPSIAIRSPGLIKTISPTSMVLMGLMSSPSSVLTNAILGCNCCRLVEADKADFLLEASRYRPIKITKIKLTTVSKYTSPLVEKPNNTYTE